MAEDLDHAEIRIAIQNLCSDFPGEYWRRLDREAAYPEEFVAALTETGYHDHRVLPGQVWAAFACRLGRRDAEEPACVPPHSGSPALMSACRWWSASSG